MAYISALPASSAILSGRSNKICQISPSFLPRRALPRTQTVHTSLQCVLRPQSAVRPARTAIRTAAAPASQASKDENLMEMELDIAIKGMMCDGCTSRVQEALEKAEGVSSVKVSLEQGMATVDVRVPSQLEAFAMLPRLVETVRVLGFEAEPHIDGL